jgi:quinol monooxygenase YgiN
MSLIAVEAAITIADPSMRQALIEKSAPIQKATRDDEPGCLVYCFAADPCQDDLIQVYELWESEEALAAHLVHPNYHDMRAMLGAGGLVSAPSRKHRIEKSAPVYGDDHIATASFD